MAGRRTYTIVRYDLQRGTYDTDTIDLDTSGMWTVDAICAAYRMQYGEAKHDQGTAVRLAVAESSAECLLL
jgi:hypothetical protein